MCVCVRACVRKHTQSAQSRPTLCDPMDCNPPGSSVHGILQARILEWAAMPSSMDSSWLRDWTHLLQLLYRWVILYQYITGKKIGCIFHLTKSFWVPQQLWNKVDDVLILEKKEWTWNLGDMFQDHIAKGSEALYFWVGSFSVCRGLSILQKWICNSWTILQLQPARLETPTTPPLC